mmetsp:Transcript_44117/g.70817  ORF Transcript_44117/g.70817 Transcript_44117/m.70817 type:complete len:644 (-) Transcript_44117:780-2711(-)
MLPSMIRRVRAARAKLSRDEKNRLRAQLLCIAAAVACATSVLYAGGNTPASLFGFTDEGAGSASVVSAADTTRHLLSGGGKCKPTKQWEKVGGIVAYFAGVFFMFLGIAIVCDDFFVASLEQICEVLQLSDDVAGATFMAAGSSAPELASSAMSLINPDAGSEIGVGTIVGSAIFNILIIIGATVISTGKTLQLDWKPVTRDCLFYAAAIGGIVGTFQDGRTSWWEGAIFVACYCGYIITMKFNVHLMEWMDRMAGGDGSNVKKGSSFGLVKSIGEASGTSQGSGPMRARDTAVLGSPRRLTDLTKVEESGAEKLDQDESASIRAKALWRKLKPKQSLADVVISAQAEMWKSKVSIIGGWDSEDEEESVADGRTPRRSLRSLHKLTPTLSQGHIRAYRAEAIKVAAMLKRKEEAAALAAEALEEGTQTAVSEDADEDDEGGSPFAVPDKCKDYPMWILSLPWYAVFTFTIPPCASVKWRKYYLLSFAMSIFWIGFITHWMVEWCVRIGCILNIPSVVMGTTVLAAGTSIPDALSSIAVARDGLADMAVANAVGSNVFDIWLGLGLPWLLYLSWQQPNYILVNTTELVPSSLILAGVLVLYYGAIASNGFRLTLRMGYFFIATYAVYATYSIVFVWLLDVYDLQ